MKTKFFKLAAVLLILAGSFYACKDKKDKEVEMTGTIVGSYSNGFISLLVQVDGEYPIGKTVEYVENTGGCTHLPVSGTYHNTIQVQSNLPLSGTSLIGKRISFLCRPYTEKDAALFIYAAGNTFCSAPDAPVYVITVCRENNEQQYIPFLWQ